MFGIKPLIKYSFQYTGPLHLVDKIKFLSAKWKNIQKNREFKKQHQDFAIPPDYFLYETFQLDYSLFKTDGLIATTEIIQWTRSYFPPAPKILEWGCGVARICRHLQKLLPENAEIYACDINNEMISWNKENIHNVQFDKISYEPPTIYSNQKFDLIYGLSVFTHIDDKAQLNWINEIARITRQKGIFLFTTHGSGFTNKLSSFQIKELKKKGSYTINYKKAGHRMMTTYNDPAFFNQLLHNSFSVLEYYEGKLYPEKAGGQDLWIVQKK